MTRDPRAGQGSDHAFRMGRVIWLALLCWLLAGLVPPGAARATEAETVQVAAPVEPRVGRSTGDPLPRYVSLKGETGFVRRGPSWAHRIDWVFQRRGMPLQVVAEFDVWRKVRDRDGAGGWMNAVVLSRNRTVIVQDDLVALRARPEPDAPIRARAETGVVADLGPCNPDWCRIRADRISGWVPKTALWGVDPDEIRD